MCLPSHSIFNPIADLLSTVALRSNLAPRRIAHPHRYADPGPIAVQRSFEPAKIEVF
jgi:hypothetical protein